VALAIPLHLKGAHDESDASTVMTSPSANPCRGSSVATWSWVLIIVIVELGLFGGFGVAA
jgi:hypothetical protein